MSSLMGREEQGHFHRWYTIKEGLKREKPGGGREEKF